MITQQDLREKKGSQQFNQLHKLSFRSGATIEDGQMTYLLLRVVLGNLLKSPRGHSPGLLADRWQITSRQQRASRVSEISLFIKLKFGLLDRWTWCAHPMFLVAGPALWCCSSNSQDSALTASLLSTSMQIGQESRFYEVLSHTSLHIMV